MIQVTIRYNKWAFPKFTLAENETPQQFIDGVARVINQKGILSMYSGKEIYVIPYTILKKSTIHIL
jgi:hypothetical protein